MAPTVFIAIRLRSAKVRFCAGAIKSSPAVIASSTVRAWLISKAADMVVSRSDSAVHEIALTWPGGVMVPRSYLSRGITGPFAVQRKRSVTAGPSLTLMMLSRVRNGAHPLGLRYSSGLSGFTSSIMTSTSSTIAVVRPHPSASLRPLRISGIPGIVPPMMPPLSNSSRARYQIDGAVRPRCGSLANRVDPVVDRDALAAHAFEAPRNCAGLIGDSGSAARRILGV